MAENFDPVWMIMFIVRIVFAVGIVFFMSFLILSITITLDDDELKRFSHELAENLLNSELTASKGVISEAKLERFISDSAEVIRNNYPGLSDVQRNRVLGDESPPYPNIEPNFARHCLIGYSAYIREINGDGFWEFGYRSWGLEEYGLADENFKSSQESFPISIMKEDGSLRQAEMELRVFIDPMSRYSCLAERAKAAKEKQELGMPLCTISKCKVSIRNFYDKNNYICEFKIITSPAGGPEPEYTSCRYVPDVSVIPSSFTYLKDEKKKLVAYPVKEGAPYADIMSDPDNAMQLSLENCDSIKTNRIATNTDTVGHVVFCMEPG